MEDNSISLYARWTYDLGIEDLKYLVGIFSPLWETPVDKYPEFEDFLKTLSIQPWVDDILGQLLKTDYTIAVHEIEDGEIYTLGDGTKVTGDYLNHFFLPFVAMEPDNASIRVYNQSNQ